MPTKFTKEQAIEYCKSHHINMLKSDKIYLDEEAVFKLFSVSDDLLMHYIVEGLEVADDYIITPKELLLRKADSVVLDTSVVRIIRNGYVDITEE